MTWQTQKASSWVKLKRLARYLLEHPRLEWEFPCSGEVSPVVEVFSDSDWGGCRRSRKSTSGGTIDLGRGTLKSWSSTQATVATSSGSPSCMRWPKRLPRDLVSSPLPQTWAGSSMCESG